MHFNIKTNSTFVKRFEVNEKSYFHVFKDTKNYKVETEAPLYEQILQIENIELHKLAKIIENNGGTVLDLSTDKIVCNFPETNILPFELDEDNNLKGYYFDDSNTVYKYKLENKDDRIKVSRMEKFRRRDKDTYTEQHYNLYMRMLKIIILVHWLLQY